MTSRVTWSFQIYQTPPFLSMSSKDCWDPLRLSQLPGRGSGYLGCLEWSVGLPSGHWWAPVSQFSWAVTHGGVGFCWCVCLWVISAPVRNPSSDVLGFLLWSHSGQKRCGEANACDYYYQQFSGLFCFWFEARFVSWGASLQFVKVMAKLKLENTGLGVSMQFISLKDEKKAIKMQVSWDPLARNELGAERWTARRPF